MDVAARAAVALEGSGRLDVARGSRDGSRSRPSTLRINLSEERETRLAVGGCRLVVLDLGRVDGGRGTNRSYMRFDVGRSVRGSDSRSVSQDVIACPGMNLRARLVSPSPGW